MSSSAMRAPGRPQAALSSTMKWSPTLPLGLRKRASSSASSTRLSRSGSHTAFQEALKLLFINSTLKNQNGSTLGSHLQVVKMKPSEVVLSSARVVGQHCKWRAQASAKH
jgi:hypothetical protein